MKLRRIISRLLAAVCSAAKRRSHILRIFRVFVCDRVTRNTMFGLDHSVLIAGALSYPFGSRDQGGYVLYRYTVMNDSDIYTTNAILSYVHLSSPLHIPYANTEDLIFSGAYTFVDRLQQHDTNYESLEFRERSR